MSTLIMIHSCPRLEFNRRNEKEGKNKNKEQQKEVFENIYMYRSGMMKQKARK